MTAPVPGKAEALPFEEAARKDSAVHVSLSSDSLFKQPGTSRFRRPDGSPDMTGDHKARHIRRGDEHGHNEHGRMLSHRVKQ
jgi:hypothetical protein